MEDCITDPKKQVNKSDILPNLQLAGPHFRDLAVSYRVDQLSNTVRHHIRSERKKHQVWKNQTVMNYCDELCFLRLSIYILHCSDFYIFVMQNVGLYFNNKRKQSIIKMLVFISIINDGAQMTVGFPLPCPGYHGIQKVVHPFRFKNIEHLLLGSGGNQNKTTWLYL